MKMGNDCEEATLAGVERNLELEPLHMQLARAADHLAEVRDWCVIPDETESGINGTLEWLIEMAGELEQYE